MGASKNRGTPKSSILIRLSIINHPFWGVFPLFLETPIFNRMDLDSLNKTGMSTCHGQVGHLISLGCDSRPEDFCHGVTAGYLVF